MSGKTNQNLWCKVADIPRNTIFMMSLPCKGFFDLWPKMGLGIIETKLFTLFRGDFSEMCYLRSEFDAQCEFLANKMIKNPGWALRLIDRIERWSRDFFKASRKQRRINLKPLSNRELLKVFKLPYRYHLMSHAIGASISWHADAEKERVTKAMIQMVDEQIKKRKLKLVAPVVFSTLSTPARISIVEQEELAFLKIAAEIKKKKRVVKIFKESKLGDIADKLLAVDKKIYQLTFRHYRRYRWIPYQYKGPAYSYQDFLGRWQALLQEGSNPTQLIKQIKKKQAAVKKEKQRLLKLLRFDKYQRDLIKLAQRLVFIKDYRKMALYHGMFCYEPIFKEIGRRFGMSFDQVTAMNHWEIVDLLRGKSRLTVDELNERLKECAAFYDGKEYVVYIGKKFKQFMAKVKFEKKELKNDKELFGTCASPGKVRGVVKIVNLPEEMHKMKKGDIMVAHNTNPNLVPAMKKAAALISEAGGLTCHTAIVARELKIPCVVGVPLADKVLKDGDLVEVDAEQGVVKIIKKKGE